MVLYKIAILIFNKVFGPPAHSCGQTLDTEDKKMKTAATTRYYYFSAHKYSTLRNLVPKIKKPSLSNYILTINLSKNLRIKVCLRRNLFPISNINDN